ncbi:hypothetical protein N7452_004665 [Penicillium brevicompactum]|uniref:Uncharacterized protein n=1 Tax=Penicillium brevicompactum TaxID=5074 RepID=A0A9W9QH52_PENBR|nr:hypothetical protein N7452_004665 [Penicillium brevicompactum]
MYLGLNCIEQPATKVFLVRVGDGYPEGLELFGLEVMSSGIIDDDSATASMTLWDGQACGEY